jgi:hypothetical protein
MAVADRLWHCPGWINSLIISAFPPLFEEFRAKCFNLLWRASRNGFTAKEFHRRCDGRANTLTLISDTDGNVFGGFTPVEWESGLACKGDDSLRSFLFTLRNPHGVPPRKFALRAERKHNAISLYFGYCAAFGDTVLAECDIAVSNNCNANRDSYTHFGTRWFERVYANNSTFQDLFTGGEHFRVKEIEVFEITDYTALPADVEK